MLNDIIYVLNLFPVSGLFWGEQKFDTMVVWEHTIVCNKRPKCLAHRGKYSVQ